MFFAMVMLFSIMVGFGKDIMMAINGVMERIGHIY